MEAFEIEETERAAKNDRTNFLFLLRSCIVVCGGGFIFGYDIGIVSNTLLDIKDSIPMDSIGEGLVVSIIGLGAIFGAVLGGPLCDYLGRWKVIMIQNFGFVVGAVITASAHNLSTLCAGRFIVGISSALSAIADIPYMTEVSPKERRGQAISMYEIMVSCGILVSFMVGWMNDSSGDSWRGSYVVPALLCVLLSLLMLLLPESPKWLLAKGRLGELREALQVVYGPSKFRFYWQLLDQENKGSLPASPGATLPDGFSSGDTRSGSGIPEEIRALYDKSLTAATEGAAAAAAVAANPLEASKEGSPLVQDMKVMSEYSYLIIAVLLMQGLTQFSGGTVVRNYAMTLFVESGSSRSDAMQWTVFLGVIKLVVTIITVYFIEKLGRRKLLMLGAASVGVGMLIICVSLAASSGGHSPNGGFILGTAVVIGAYGIGYGPVAWALSSEMFPVSIRGRVLALALVSQNASLLVVNLVYLEMLQSMTPEGTFAFYFFFNFACFALTYMYLPETKCQSPESILAMAAKYRAAPWTHWKRQQHLERIWGDHEPLDSQSSSTKSSPTGQLSSEVQNPVV